MAENTTYAQNLARKNWDRARQAALVQGVLSVFSGRSIDLLSFEEVKTQLRLTQMSYRGIHTVKLAQIRGSVGRYRDFTNTFLPRRSAMRERWQRVDAVTFMKGLTPIEVYKVGDAYFVLDGNHRVSVARQAGATTIEAHVWEYTTPVGLSADADLDEVLIKAEYAEFLQRTEFGKLYPDERIEFTTPGRYREIELQIAVYQKVLEKIDKEPIEYPYAVASWYEMIYTPAIQIIKERGVTEHFPDRTEADLFIWVCQHHQALQKSGRKSLADTADELNRKGIGILKRIWQGIKRLFAPSRG